MKTINSGTIPGNSWNLWYMKGALRSLVTGLRRNEDWLLGAVLGENADARLFAEQCADDGWRGKDYVYAFMTEKDIQARLASELLQISRRCHVHVEVPVYGRTNRRARRPSKPFNMRPDILLLSTRRREKRVGVKERNLEVSAVEIKYFKRYQKPWVAGMVEDDLDKLWTCMNSRVEPRADNGFFVCVDESGAAERCLKRLLARKSWRRQRIGYLVITPRHVEEQRMFPMEFEKYEQGLERGAVYIMDKALGALKRDFPSLAKETLKCDRSGGAKQSAGPWFYIRRGRKRVGWAYFDWCFRDGRRVRPALIVFLYAEAEGVRDPGAVVWDGERDGYRYTERPTKQRAKLVVKRNYPYAVGKMNRVAERIYNALRKILLRAERAS